MTEVKEPTFVERMEAQRSSLVAEWAQLIKNRDVEKAAFEERQNGDEFKALSDEDRTVEIDAFRAAEATFKEQSDQREQQLHDFDDGIRQRELVEKRLGEAAKASAGKVTVGDEPLTYNRHNARGSDSISYYADFAAVMVPEISLRTRGTRDSAQQRLVRHAQEMEVEMPKRAKAREERARKQFEDAETEAWAKRGLKMDKGGLPYDPFETEARTRNPFETRVEPNLSQGQGGYFVPPLWLVDEYIPGLRAHRIAANLPRQMDLPPGTDSINIPKLNTLTVVGYQQVNNSGLPSQDFTDTVVTANVKTIGGYEDVGLQVLELSPHGIVDEVVTRDLMAAYDKFLDAEVIAGDGTNAGTLNGGHLMGIYPSTNWSGTNTVTYTDGSPTPSHMPPGVFGPMASKIARTRFDATNLKFVAHGRRAMWYVTGLDVNGRPLGETAAGGPYNTQALQSDGVQAEGLIARLPYLMNTPLYIDDNVPTTDNTDGGGATRDVVIGGLWDDAWLFEGALRTDVFREVLSASLGVRFRIYNYAALLVRYGQSFAVATGSGFAPPSTGYGDFF